MSDPIKPTKKPKTITRDGREYEVIRRYRDAHGGTWTVVKMPMFPDGRPGAKQPSPEDYLEGHFSDPPAEQPQQSVGNTALEV
jgi:hypothetical protein